jgi:hypothetical protein
MQKIKVKNPYSKIAEGNGNFKAIFLVGGPGSGKDFLIHSVLAEHSLKEISLEKLFSAILEQKNLDELNSFPSIVVNGNADNQDKIIVAKAILENMGYDTSMIYVFTTNEESKRRNDLRILKNAKTFNESMRTKKYNLSVNNMHEFVEMFEAFILYDNSNNITQVNEEKKVEIRGWLNEMATTVEAFLLKKPTNEEARKWIQEKVLEVGTKSTADFVAALTPGADGTKKVRTYAEAEKKSCACKENDCGCGGKKEGGIAVADFNAPGRTFAEAVAKRQSTPPSVSFDNSSKGVYGVSPLSSSGGVTSPTINTAIYGEDSPKLKKLFKVSPPVKAYGEVANLGNPSAGIGLIAYSVQESSKSFKNFSKGKLK